MWTMDATASIRRGAAPDTPTPLAVAMLAAGTVNAAATVGGGTAKLAVGFV